MLTIVHQNDKRTVHSQDASVVPALIANTSAPFWLDLEAPTEEEFAILERVFEFHPLAIEDAMRPCQRPKVDEYEGYFFLIADEVYLRLDSLQTPELSGAGTTIE